MSSSHVKVVLIALGTLETLLSCNVFCCSKESQEPNEPSPINSQHPTANSQTTHPRSTPTVRFLPGAAAWCQAAPGSCVGELRTLEKHRFHGLDLRSTVTGVIQRFENTSKDLLRFIDWDGDGDVDILLGTYEQNAFRILFQERISEDSYSYEVRVHELVTLAGLRRNRPISKDWYFFNPDRIDERDRVAEAYRSNSSTVEGFQVTDWDGDGRLDLLLCMQGPTVSNITFLSRALLPVNSTEDGSLILSTSSVRQDTLCDMQSVDFDGDGVVDLFLGGFTRYFARQSADSDLIEQRNPLSIYNGSVLQVFDFDADGDLELLLDASGPNDHIELVSFRWLRRALDGSFVESEENPFVDVQLRNQGRSGFRWHNLATFFSSLEEMYLTDWNSDGLPDVVVVGFAEGYRTSFVRDYARWYQQVRDQDMMYNSHLTVFEDIRVSYDQISVLDWNQDGFDDHVDIRNHPQLYEISDVGAKPVPFPEKPDNGWLSDLSLPFSFVDWDGDGDLDLLVGRGRLLEYWEQVDGQFSWGLLDVRIHYDLKLKSRYLSDLRISTVDWDQDGDVDLILGDEDGKARYYERLQNGDLREKQQHPFKGIYARRRYIESARFLDCDGDGDLDVLRVNVDDPRPIQACEHDKDAGTLTCRDDFFCLGTNLSNFRLGRGDAFDRFGRLVSLDLVNVSDGRLKFAAIHADTPTPVLWTAGFCTPRNPCHGKGFCKERQQHCTCQKGHELEDCSQCERNFHGVFQHVWQMRECKSCPESDGHLCHGRGECFDDAQELRDSTALLVAGNGSCRCHEAVILLEKLFSPKQCGHITKGSCSYLSSLYFSTG